MSLRATAQGQQAARAWPASYAAVIDGLSAAEQALLLKLTVRMIRQLQLRGMIAPQRTCVSCRHFRENAEPGAAAPHFCALVGAAMADHHLRVDCPEHEAA